MPDPDVGDQVTMSAVVLMKGSAVRLHGVVWGSPFAETAIVQLPSGALIAVPVGDLEQGAPLGTVRTCLSFSVV